MRGYMYRVYVNLYYCTLLMSKNHNFIPLLCPIATVERYLNNLATVKLSLGLLITFIHVDTLLCCTDAHWVLIRGHCLTTVNLKCNTVT